MARTLPIWTGMVPMVPIRWVTVPRGATVTKNDRTEFAPALNE